MTLKVVNDILSAQVISVPGVEGEHLGLLVNYQDATDGLWALEKGTVDKLKAALHGDSLSENSLRILRELSRTEIVSHWGTGEDESGTSMLHLVLYGQVSVEMPLFEADSAIQMLDTVLHAQGHAQLST